MLTKSEEKIFTFISEYWKAHGFSPSVRDIAKGCYISNKTAHQYVLKLFDKGYIDFVPNLSRTIKIKKKHM